MKKILMFLFISILPFLTCCTKDNIYSEKVYYDQVGIFWKSSFNDEQVYTQWSYFNDSTIDFDYDNQYGKYKVNLKYFGTDIMESYGNYYQSGNSFVYEISSIESKNGQDIKTYELDKYNTTWNIEPYEIELRVNINIDGLLTRCNLVFQLFFGRK